MPVRGGALAHAPELRDQPLTRFVEVLRVVCEAELAPFSVASPIAETMDRWRLVAMASLADLCARDVLLHEIAGRTSAAVALAS